MVQDSECYIYLMHMIDPDMCSLDVLSETDLEKRAEAVIDMASKLGCDQFVSKTEILQVSIRHLLRLY